MPASFSRVFLFGVVKLEHAGRPCNPINKNNHWHRLITRTKIASHGLSTMGGGGGDRQRETLRRSSRPRFAFSPWF